MVLGGCIDHQGCQPACPSSYLSPFPWPLIGCILTVVAEIGGLMDEPDEVDNSWIEHMLLGLNP